MNWHTTDKVKSQFEAAFGERIQFDQPLAKYTSARVGGAAEMFMAVRTGEEMVAALTFADRLGVPIFVLGGGSNILIADAGISGLVLHNRSKAVSFRNTGFSIVCTADSGVNLSSLSRQCISKGLGGLEWGIGVPGTVGGAVANNAGAHGSDMSATIVSAMVWEPQEGVRMMPVSEMQYAYRSSVFKHAAAGEPNRVVISADLQLRPEAGDVLHARAAAFTSHRKQTQPSGATMGSIFKNPEHYYAGYLVEAAGMKGYRIGGVEVSQKHGNWFINDENATAEEIRSLLAEVWHAVYQQFRIRLEPEIELIGNWEFELESERQPDEPGVGGE